MSIVTSVIFRGKLPDRKTLSRTLTELGFPFTIAASVGSLERHSGYMPMWLRREETGVEFDVETDRERVEIAEMEGLAGKKVDPTFDRVANFRWAGDEREMLAGMCGAAALAKLVNGVVFDDQESRLFSVDEAIACARQHLQSVPKWYRSGLRGTRPADIKHYLKPLLKQRSDLVLVGRLLLIRPVRHVARGALLSPSSDKYRFKILPYLHLLCCPDDVGERIRGPNMDATDAWQPHFEPLLMDVLANDIFRKVGKIANLDDFAAAVSEKSEFPQRARALALSRGREYGTAYVNDVERRHPDHRFWKPWYLHLRELFEQSTDDICARYRAAEERTVKELKLDRIWESSPFPIEIRPEERQTRSDEPAFEPQPWIVRPPGLVEGMPENPGDVCFAKEKLFREWDNPLLVASISREEAAERHRNAENYVLAARLPDGLLLLLCHHATDRHDPSEVRSVLAGYLLIELHGARFVAQADVFHDDDAEGMMELSFVTVYRRATRQSVWLWSFDRADGEQGSEDYRSGQRMDKLSDVDTDRLTFREPGFAEFQKLVELIQHVLRSAGFGELT